MSSTSTATGHGSTTVSRATMRWEVYELATGNTVALVPDEQFSKRIIRWDRFSRDLRPSMTSAALGRRHTRPAAALGYREIADPDAAWKGGAA